MKPYQLKKKLGISYLGNCISPKLLKSLGKKVLTYGIHLAPHTMSGYNVCPQSQQCRHYCLNGSGRNKLELFGNKRGGIIQQARIKKTKLFFEDREAFMKILISEIWDNKLRALNEKLDFAVRLNVTSDISLEDFVFDGKNILELFPDVQFYDYTKVYNRIELAEKYLNYDITFSYDGTNWTLCEILLEKGYRAAVVFEDVLPETFRGYSVIDANQHDARFLDKTGIVCGLTYKRVITDYEDGKFRMPNTPFINKVDNTPVKWCSPNIKLLAV